MWLCQQRALGRLIYPAFWLGTRGHESDEYPKRLTYLGFVRLKRRRSNPYSTEPSAETPSKNPAFHKFIPISEPTEGNTGVTCSNEANLHFQRCIFDLGTELKAIQNLTYEFCRLFVEKVEWRLPCKPASGEGGKRKHIERFLYKHHERQLIIKSISKRLWQWGDIYKKDVFSWWINIPTAITPPKFDSIHSALSTLSQADGCAPNHKLHRHKETGIKHSIQSI